STTLALIAGSRRIQTGTVEVLGGDMAAGRHQAAICPRTRSVTTQAVRKRGRVGRELASASAGRQGAATNPGCSMRRAMCPKRIGGSAIPAEVWPTSGRNIHLGKIGQAVAPDRLRLDGALRRHDR